MPALTGSRLYRFLQDHALVNAAFAVALAMIIIGTALAWRATARLAENRRWVFHTHEVIEHLDDLLIMLADAETGQRGYLLTGQESYLEPYAAAVTRVDSAMNALATLVADNPAQAPRLAELRMVAGQKLQELGRTIALVRQGAVPDALATVRADTGKRLMDDARRIVAAMEDEERNLLQERSRLTAASNSILLWCIGLSGALSLLLVGLAFGLSRRGIAVERETAQQIAEQKERLRTTLASIGDGVITTDERGMITGMNAVAEGLTRWSLDEARGRHVDEVFRIIDRYTRKPVANPALRALNEGVIVGLANSVLLVAQDGSELPMDDSAAPIRCAEGKIVGAVVVFRDVTERQRTRDRLRQAHTRLQSAMAAGEIGTWELDVHSGNVRCDAHCAELLNEAPGEREYVREDFTRAIDGDGTVVRDAIVAALKDGTAFDLVLPRPGAVGRWIAVRGRVERDDAGQVVRVPAVVVDVTAQRQAEDRERQLLEESATANAKFRAFFEQSVLFAGIMDVDGTIAETNRLAWEGCGYTRDQIVGIPFWEGPWWTPSPALVQQVRAASVQAARGEAFRAEMPYYVAGGIERMVDLSISPVRNAAGEVVFLAPTGNDITERKQAERDRDRLERELQALASSLSEADRRKDEFLATLAHELRNPLAPMRNGLEIMRLSRDEEKVEQARAMMTRQLEQMVHLVEDLLDVNRISSGKLELRRQEVELAAVIQDAVEMSRPFIEQKGQVLELSLPSEPVMVQGDNTRLVQVFANLLTNAAKYSEPGTPIRVSAELVDHKVVVSVRDQGIGIPPGMLTRVFDLFTQVDGTRSRSQGGLGIGLTLVRKLVEMHGGTVEARSDGEGRGSEFVVRLPR